ncbi:MAG: GFA family protein [Pseudomonadota bacterium]
METKSGGCLCGTVRFRYEGSENWQAYCHCETCRRNTSSPVTAFVGVPVEAYEFTGKKPAIYRSSPGVRRLFCATCGSPIAFETDKLPHEIHFHAAAFDHPQEFVPERHFFFEEHLPWISIDDDLPRHMKGG